MLRELRFKATRERKQQAILEADRLRDVEPDDPPLPEMPTAFWAGSRGKVEVMRQRAERREAIFHPDDCKQKVEKRFEAFHQVYVHSASLDCAELNTTSV